MVVADVKHNNSFAYPVGRGETFFDVSSCVPVNFFYFFAPIVYPALGVRVFGLKFVQDFFVC